MSEPAPGLVIDSNTGIDVSLPLAGPGVRSYAFIVDWQHPHHPRARLVRRRCHLLITAGCRCRPPPTTDCAVVRRDCSAGARDLLPVPPGRRARPARQHAGQARGRRAYRQPRRRGGQRGRAAGAQRLQAHRRAAGLSTVSEWRWYCSPVTTCAAATWPPAPCWSTSAPRPCCPWSRSPARRGAGNTQRGTDSRTAGALEYP